jgi:hypothetical protein
MRGSKPGERRGGRQKGTPNKISHETMLEIRAAILEAGRLAGGKDGMVGYLEWLAKANSSAFATLLGKILPTQVEGPSDSGAHVIEFRWQPPS